MRLTIIDTSILAVFIDVLIPELWGGELAISMDIYRYVSFHLFFHYRYFSLWDSFFTITSFTNNTYNWIYTTDRVVEFPFVPLDVDVFEAFPA